MLLVVDEAADGTGAASHHAVRQLLCLGVGAVAERLELTKCTRDLIRLKGSRIAENAGGYSATFATAIRNRSVGARHGNVRLTYKLA